MRGEAAARMTGPAPGPARAKRITDGWGTYLAFVILLMPVIVPIGTFQLAIIDAFNLIALVVFGIAVLSRRIELKVPFALGAFVIAVASLVAIVNAESPAASVLALAQDAYLYVWFIMLVSVLSARGDLVGLRLGWAGIAAVVTIIGFAVVFSRGNTTLAGIVGPKGVRNNGTFSDPNMAADYMAMSLFIMLSLGQHMGRALRWGLGLLLVAGIVSTKSNGGALSLFVGLIVWAVVRARTGRFPFPAFAGGALLALSLVLGGLWVMDAVGAGSHGLHNLQSKSFLARGGHSAAGRLKIWRQLEASFRKAPLGIGPGNSRWMTVSVEGRERPNSMYSKEAHSDYLAYAIERGPLAILALLLVLWQAFGMLRTVWLRRMRSGAADPATGALVAGLAGALACSAVHSLTIERLHFRHFWLLLAIVCACAEAARAQRAGQNPASLDGVKGTEPLAATGA